MRSVPRLFLAAGVLAACSADPKVIPTKNLDRPTDLGFVCLGAIANPSDPEGPPVLSGQTMDVCHPRDAVDPAITTGGQRTLGTFAFVPNAGRGELAVADLDSGRLLDLTPRSPGYGMLPIGGDPEMLAVSPDGCWAVTANRTSCDFTLIDPARLLSPTFSSDSVTVVAATGQGEPARHLRVQTGAQPPRPLSTAVGEIAFLPASAPTPACQAGSTARAVATFPGCDLIAILDLSFDDATATIRSSYHVRPGGLEDAGSAPSCPRQCATAEDPQLGDIDGGPPAWDGAVPGLDGGASSVSPAYVQALAVVPDGSRVYVGARLDPAVTVFALDQAGLSAPVRTTLAENPGGVSRLRLGIDPFLTTPVTFPDGSAGKVSGAFLRGRGSFLYAFAADDSIRVLNLDGPVPIECDVNIALPVGDPRRTAPCLPVGTPGRRALASGPGVLIPTFANPDTPPPLARDIAFADFQAPGGTTNYHALAGQHGFVLASSGQVFVLNVAPSGEEGATKLPADTCATHLPEGTEVRPAIATHSFREVRDVGQCARTPIGVSIAPQRSVIRSDQAFATSASFTSLGGPLIRSYSTDRGLTTSWFDFPDPETIISRSWDVIWEGALPGTTRLSGRPRSGGAGLAGSLGDAGADFCASSVRPGDVLMISGCTQNSDCQPDDQFSCQISVSGARGMCLPKASSESVALVERCGRFMGSRMRYEVARATPLSLDLRLKLDEVPKTTLNPCTEDADCRPDNDHGLLAGETPDGGGRRAFECVEVLPGERRCVQRCSAAVGSDAECRAGHVCERVPWALPTAGGPGLCVEAPPMDEQCFPQPMTSYSVRAGHAYLVYGSSMPTLHTGRVGPDGTCTTDPTADPTLVDRIPLSAPRCPETFLAGASAATGKLVQNLSAEPGANPCLYQGAQHDGSGAGSESAVRAFFQNPQLRFVLTNLDVYAGDLLAIHFELQYGFVPLTIQVPSYEVLLTLGTRILTGPTKTPESPIRRSPPTDFVTYPYLYVVDQGRTALTPGSRGQVLRINARAGSNEIATFDTTTSGSTPFLLQ